MTITLTTKKLQGGWEVRADCDVGLCCAQGSSEIQAREGALSMVLRRIYEELEEGRLDPVEVFPIDYEPRS